MMLQHKLNENVLRSAMASKVAYAKTMKHALTFPVMAQLHGPISKINQCNLLKEHPECSWIIHPSSSSAHAYAWRSGTQSTLIAFKGSSSLEDVASFLDMKQIDFSFCEYKMRVHSGVMKMFESIEPEMTAQLLRDPPSAKPHFITFCGHSLGGALAIFASAYYANLTNKNATVHCHTFGAPKIGDDIFYEWFTRAVDDHLHIANEKDIISYLPLDIMGYKSFSNNTFFITDAQYTSLNVYQTHDLDTYIDYLRKITEVAKIPPIK